MKQPLDKIIEELVESAKRDTEFSRDLGAKFFFHWAILSGAAITLLIPFLSIEAVQIKIDSCSKIFVHITVISFFISLFISSVRNFLLKENIITNANIKFETADDLSKYLHLTKGYNPKKQGQWKIVKLAEYTAITSFLVGIISAYIFISKVIL